MTTEKRTQFVADIRTAINKLSLENDNDTPDFILAEYLADCFESYSKAVKARDKWFGVDMWSENKLAKNENETHIINS